jgi:long-chain fatty acid transport protein
MMKFSGTQASLLVFSGILSGTVFGAGFSLNEQSARSLGQAFSGRASDADTASTLVGNPAGMSLLTNAQITAGFSLIDAHTDIKDASGTAAGANVSGSNQGDMIPFTAIPFGYYVQPIDDHWAAGVGIYVPFGLTTEYDDDFQGRYFGVKSAIKVLTLQPTVSYKFDNGLAVGVGVTYNRFDGHLTKSVYNPLAPTSDINGGVRGDDTAWGYNVGVLYQFNPETRIGLTYYSRVKYTLEGHTDLDNAPVTLGGPSVRYDASLAIETPDKIDFGFTHALTPQLTLRGEITRTNWATLKEIRVENKNANPLVAETVEPLDWDSSMFYSLGLSYQVDSVWTLRGGLGLDKQPIPNSTRSVRLPAGDRTLLGLGATWTAADNLSVDLGYMYIKEKSVRVDQTTTALVTNSPIEYRAKFESYVNLLSAQVNWKF